MTWFIVLILQLTTTAARLSLSPHSLVALGGRRIDHGIDIDANNGHGHGNDCPLRAQSTAFQQSKGPLRSQVHSKEPEVSGGGALAPPGNLQ